MLQTLDTLNSSKKKNMKIELKIMASSDKLLAFTTNIFKVIILTSFPFSSIEFSNLTSVQDR